MPAHIRAVVKPELLVWARARAWPLVPEKAARGQRSDPSKVRLLSSTGKVTSIPKCERAVIGHEDAFNPAFMPYCITSVETLTCGPSTAMA